MTQADLNIQGYSVCESKLTSNKIQLSLQKTESLLWKIQVHFNDLYKGNHSKEKVVDVAVPVAYFDSR